MGLIRTIPLAPFETAVRSADGRWMLIRPREPLWSPGRLRLLLAFGLSAVLLAPLAWWSARRLTRPVQLFAEAAERLGLDPGAPSLKVEGPLEVRTAAASFNLMQERLREYIRGRTAMVAAIAHDLRTPLTGLRLRAESAPDPERARMAADIARMEA
jgi:signal transduction histidine kinase